jgi:RNA methyltransferase, TrmH family
MRPTKYDFIKERYEKGLVEQKPFSVLIDNFHTDINVGLLIRTAAALGAREIFIVGQKQWQKNVACAADKFIPISYCDNNDDMYELIKNTYRIVCLEQTADASFLPSQNYPENPIFVLGNETTGISEFWLDKANKTVQIKMFGGPKSLNVNVAAGILFADYLNKLH